MFSLLPTDHGLELSSSILCLFPPYHLVLLLIPSTHIKHGELPCSPWPM